MTCEGCGNGGELKFMLRASAGGQLQRDIMFCSDECRTEWQRPWKWLEYAKNNDGTTYSYVAHGYLPPPMVSAWKDPK